MLETLPISAEAARILTGSGCVAFVLLFAGALAVNANFNTALVGAIYLAPLLPLGMAGVNPQRFLLVTLENLIFGAVELAIFVLTVRRGDAAFDREHLKQLAGHTLPIALALIGLSLYARYNPAPVTVGEAVMIAAVFACGTVLRVLAVQQIGRLAFKFDIVFRDEQKIKTDQLYGYVRHPSYAAMMLVILAYAITAQDWTAGALGLASAWFGFQFRIHYEEKALLERFGADYAAYRARTPMWLPLPGREEEGGRERREMSEARRKLGEAGEKAAVDFLRRNGYRILKTRWRTPAGEIDIIAEHETVLVFVEVKTRSDGEFGHPFTAITPAKRRKLTQLARGFIAKHGIKNRDCRFDVVAIIGATPDNWRIELLPDAFRIS